MEDYPGIGKDVFIDKPLGNTLGNGLKKGEEFFSTGRIKEAHNCFEAVIQEDPRNREAYNNLGVIAYREGNMGEAFDLISKALTMDPFYKEALLNFSHVLRKLDQLPQIVPFMERVLRRYPNDKACLNILNEANSVKRDETEERATITPAEIHADRMGEKAAPSGLKVLHGTYEIANQMKTLAAALNGAGMVAMTACYYPNYLGYTSDYMLDVSKFGNPKEAISATRRMAEKLIPEFDVFHFHFNTTLTLDHSDLPYIKQLGKVMAMHYWGSDARVLSKARELNPYAVAKDHDENGIKQRLEFMARFMSCAITTDHEMYEYLKDYFEHVHILPSVIDMTRYQPLFVKNEKFLIVHAPTSPEFKGSRHIIAAIEDLKGRYDFEFRLIQGLAHEEAKTVYSQADLVVDELYAGSYGLLTVESMAMGKPVITWVCDFMREKYPPDLPILSANPDTIREKIEFALNNREMLTELGMRGVEYVAKYHDIRKAIHKYMDVYNELCGLSN
jgi:glycosyltransferase involved in cell wall biosynthesis